jgi:hypothetical protein
VVVVGDNGGDSGWRQGTVLAMVDDNARQWLATMVVSDDDNGGDSDDDNGGNSGY